MRSILVLSLGLLCVAPACATDALTSELSHGAGGVAWGGIATYAASDLSQEHRVLIGIAAATGAGVIGELYDHSHGYGFSALDVFATAAGGAIGALVADRFFIAPVANRPPQGGHYVGVVAQFQF